MCGFIGVCDLAGIRPTKLSHMETYVAPRGRDAWQTYESAGFSAGVARLAIRGDTDGGQPLCLPDGRVFVFNGEIYGSDHTGPMPSDGSDTARLPDLLGEFDGEHLRALRGMFAIAMWDPSRQRLCLARDHAGQKPLYWTAHGPRLYFASELQTLLNLSPGPFPTDDSLVASERLLGWLPAPWTSVAGVYKLPPGSWLIFDNTGVRVRPYWRSPRPDGDRGRNGDVVELCEELGRAVAEQVMSRKVALFQSGGLDSGLLTHLAHRADANIQSWSIGVQERDGPGVQGDDNADTMADVCAATALAEELGINQRSLLLSSGGVRRWAHQAASALDDNYYTISYPLTAALFETAAEDGHRVGLSGEGADELFGGYAYLHGADRLVTQEPEALLASYVEARRRFTGAPPDPEASRQAIRLLIDACGDILDLPPWIALRHVDLRTSLPESLLARVDRLSMRAQLEVRMPYLDHRVMEQALRQAPYKSHDPLRKGMLRQAAARLGAPRAVVRAPKRRFGLSGRLLRQVLEIRREVSQTTAPMDARVLSI